MNEYRPLLSVCIPTYNRRDMVVALAKDLLADGSASIEVCIHDDGSIDGTDVALLQLQRKYPRLRLSRSENRGRASAILQLVRSATGKFIMIFDDDDVLKRGTISSVVQQCESHLPKGVGGFIFQMDFEDGLDVAPFPRPISNFLRLRADEGVRGDKKEVILSELLKSHTFDPKGRYRRVPLSLSWARIALTHDVICINKSIGIKRYLSDGITASVSRTKLRNAFPMFLLHTVRVEGFFRSRYRSVTWFWKAVVGVVVYGVVAVFQLAARP